MLVENEFTKMLSETPECKGLERVEESRSAEGIQCLKESYEFDKHIVWIVRAQWTKTQGGWAVRVLNYYAEKNHFLQIPFPTLKRCRAVIEKLKNDGEVLMWNGDVVKVKN